MAMSNVRRRSAREVGHGASAKSAEEEVRLRGKRRVEVRIEIKNALLPSKNNPVTMSGAATAIPSQSAIAPK